MRLLGVAKPRRRLDDGVEHRLEIECRPADDLEHVSGRSLLLAAIRQFARALPHLVEQPHVLDRDHRLVGEGCDQLDLLLGEWPHGYVRARR